jgi:hypothetical protein
MYHPPDLNLASSYIPACLCIIKGCAAFALFNVAPVRGWIALTSLLIVDRILWNGSSLHILDVNAVCVSLVGGLMVVHERAGGLKTVVHNAVTLSWALVSILQITNVTRFNRSYEVIFAACVVSVLSCFYQAQDRIEILALRSFVFIIGNITLPYMDVLMQRFDVDSYVNICRTGLILLGEPELAALWVVVYILSVGYQVRTSKRPKIVHHVIDDDKQPSPPASQPVTDEAALLREALANKKMGFRDV